MRLFFRHRKFPAPTLWKPSVVLQTSEHLFDEGLQLVVSNPVWSTSTPAALQLRGWSTNENLFASLKPQSNANDVIFMFDNDFFICSLIILRKNRTYQMTTDLWWVLCSRSHQLLLHCFKINPRWWCYSPHQWRKSLHFGSSVVPKWDDAPSLRDVSLILWWIWVNLKKIYSEWLLVFNISHITVEKPDVRKAGILNKLYFDLHYVGV